MHSTFERRLGTGSKAVAFGFFVVLALTFFAFVGNAKAAIESAPPPQIWSDKADYAPGETVVLTGANWAPGDSVHIRVNDDAGATWSRDVDVTADASGAISDQFNLPDWFVANYSVTAVGATGTATTSFTDGNIKFDVAPAGATAQFVETVYTAATNCTGAVANNFPKTLNGSSGDTQGAGSNESIRLDAAATSDQGGAFSAWSTTDGSPFSVITGTGGKSICIAGFQGGGTQDYRATYGAANAAPAIAANNASVTVNEGATATNTGTWSDANASNTVILSASIGAVTKSGTNASGTWSWSFGTTDGPDQSQTVTITANDGTTSTSTTFSLTVNNVAPTATFPATRTVDEGSSSSFAFTSPSDPSSADTTAGFHYAFDCTGASLATATYAGSGTSASASCSFGDGPGSQTVRARIIDKDGGFTEYTTAVTITNVAPTATFSNNGPVNEGSSFTLSMDDGDDVSSADKAAKFTFAFDCGDGSGYGAFTATATLSASQSCSTDDNGSRSVKAKIRDKDGGVREYTGSVTVNNVDPSATFNAPTEVDEGSDINISLSDVVDPGTADTHQYRFKCGAGDWTAYGASASHACPTTDNGTVTVKGQVRDDDGGESVEYSADVTVNNVDPSATFNAPTEVDEGSDINISLSDVVDPGTADTHQYRFKCGAGDWTAYGASASHACPTTDNGTVTVKGQVRDDDGGESVEYSADVTVNNVDPSATFNAPTEVDEGSDINISLSDVVDPGTADTHQYRFKCGAGDWTAYGASASHACPTTDNGTVTVKGQVRDDDGGESVEYSADVTVNNVDPSATFNAPTEVDEGSDINISLSDVVDPGTADTHQYRFKCGAGDWTAYGASASHACPTTDNGTVTVKGQVRDDDGGESVEYSADVTVNNVDPSATFNAPTEVDEGSDINISLSDVVDPGTADTHQYRFKCGAGDWTAYGASASHACPTTDNGTVTVKGQVRDDDGGESVEYSADVTVNNVDPTATFSNNGPVNEGSSFTLSMDDGDDVSSADKAAKFTFAFDCGDGSGYGAFTATATLSASQSCSTDDNGSRSVKAKIRDKDGGVREYTGSVTVNNVAPTATFSNNGPVDEGTAVTVSFADQSDPSSVDTAAGFHYAYACDNSSLGSATYAGSGTSASHNCTFGDNGSKTVRARIIDRNDGYTEYQTTVTVRNVDPTASNPSFTFDPLFGTATAGFDFSDVGWLDTHGPSLSFFTWSDVGNRYASVTEENIAPNSTGQATDTRTLNPGCYNLTVTGTAKDDDGGTSAALELYSNSATSVYGRGFRPPIMDNERNIAKYGNVVPIKVVLTNTCTGATVTDVPLFVTIHLGTGGEVFDATPVVVAESVSSADSGSQMRTADGMYIYNLSTKSLTQGKDYAIRIRPFSTTAPWILQAVLYPKK